MLELRLFFGSSVLRFVHLLRTSISWLSGPSFPVVGKAPAEALEQSRRRRVGQIQISSMRDKAAMTKVTYWGAGRSDREAEIASSAFVHFFALHMHIFPHHFLQARMNVTTVQRQQLRSEKHPPTSHHSWRLCDARAPTLHSIINSQVCSSSTYLNFVAYLIGFRQQQQWGG